MFTVPALWLLTCLLWPHPPSSGVASKSDEKMAIANIDLFGYGNLDVMKLRSVLPIKAGESIKQSEWSGYRSKIEEAIRSETGKPPTDIALVLQRPTQFHDLHRGGRHLERRDPTQTCTHR